MSPSHCHHYYCPEIAFAMMNQTMNLVNMLPLLNYPYEVVVVSLGYSWVCGVVDCYPFS